MSLLSILKRDAFSKRTYNPNQPRDERGRWTDSPILIGASSGLGAVEVQTGNPYNLTGHVQGQHVSSNGAAAAVFKEQDWGMDQETLFNTMLTKEEKLLAEQSMARVAEEIAAGRDTQTLYRDKETKKYSAERRRVHRAVMREYLRIQADGKTPVNARPKPGYHPRLLILGGRGGSGKSGIAGMQGGYVENDVLLVDADRVKGLLGKYGKPPYEGWNSALFHEESSYVAERIARHGVAMGYNVVFDATLKSGPTNKSEKVFAEKLIEAAAKRGHRVDGAFMSTTRAKAQRQSMSRWLGGLRKGGAGRLVPPDVILENTDNEANFDALTPKLDNWIIVDNNGSASDRMVVASYNGNVLVDNRESVIKARRAYSETSRILRNKSLGVRNAR